MHSSILLRPMAAIILVLVLLAENTSASPSSESVGQWFSRTFWEIWTNQRKQRNFVFGCYPTINQCCRMMEDQRIRAFPVTRTAGTIFLAPGDRSRYYIMRQIYRARLNKATPPKPNPKTNKPPPPLYPGYNNWSNLRQASEFCSRPNSGVYGCTHYDGEIGSGASKKTENFLNAAKQGLVGIRVPGSSPARFMELKCGHRLTNGLIEFESNGGKVYDMDPGQWERVRSKALVKKSGS